ncbi:MAG TPA: acetolactate decarboxylase [Ignavibacteriaceae bacterium]|nr:acetolactate decarboxylase [Ignavibacteriaceae bacterium]
MYKSLLVSIMVLIALTLISCDSNQPKGTKISSKVYVAGAMKNVMMKGELFGTVDLDTISNKDHLYGLGPVEYLTGEILIADGKSYVASVKSDSTMNVTETFKTKAPFLVYANVSNWREQRLPDSVQSQKQLESYLDALTKNAERPFAFKLTGKIESANYHLVNLSPGSKVTSKEDAHVGEVKFQITNEAVQLIGFFSTEHKGIFTHHDSFIHVHLLTEDKTKMGHLDEVRFGKGNFNLYLPLD